MGEHGVSGVHSTMADKKNAHDTTSANSVYRMGKVCIRWGRNGSNDGDGGRFNVMMGLDRDEEKWQFRSLPAFALVEPAEHFFFSPTEARKNHFLRGPAIEREGIGASMTLILMAHEY